MINFGFGPLWAANCRGFVQLIDGNPINAISGFKEALPAVSDILGGTRPHLLKATILHNLGLAAYLSNGLAQALRYFGR